MKATIKVKKNRIVAPVDFGALFAERSVCGVKLAYTEYDFIQSESGKYVLFDAYAVAHKYEHFNAECGTIAYPFCFCCKTDSGERVAYAGLRFSDEKAVVWKPLGAENIAARLVRDPDTDGVLISSGLCCFSDIEGYDRYYAHIRDERHPLAGIIVLDGQAHVRTELYDCGYAIFSSGWGDGRYGCYIGYDDGGRVVAVLADFGMIEYPSDTRELIEITVDVPEGWVYFDDPTKTETQNNISRWTAELACATTPEQRLHAYSRRGLAYHTAYDYDNALSDYLSAVACCAEITQKSELARAWSVYENAADIFCMRSDYESAIRLMTNALSIDDEFNIGAYTKLIDLYRAARRTDSALETAKQMLSRRKNDPVAYVKYAECCISAMDYAEAAKAYGILADEYELYENLFDRASCLIELGDYSAAEAALEKHPAKELCEQYWYHKAYIEYKCKRLRSAAAFAQKAYETDAEYLPALHLLIEIKSLLQEYRAVAAYAEAYKKLRPESEYGYGVCGDAHLVLGNFSECAHNYCYLYDTIRRDDKYAVIAALACAKSGEKKRADALLRKLLRKRSPYSFCIAYTLNPKRAKLRLAMFEFIDKTADRDFVTTLAQYFISINNTVAATRILDRLSGDKDMSYETAALRIRSAERIGDKKHFEQFLDYYIAKFIGKIDDGERRELAAEFINSPQKRDEWLQ